MPELGLPLWAWGAIALGSVAVGAWLGHRGDRVALGAALGLLGPLGWLVVLRLPSGPRVPCPSCKKMTPWHPRPPMGPRMSYPHLRCVHCGSIVPG